MTLINFTSEVENYFAKSDLFLHDSYTVGFPNAQLESCAVGTAVIAFKAPGGIDETIEEGISGFMAENVSEYAERIIDVLNTMDLWKPSVISQSVYEKYSSENILSKYEDLFIDISKNQSIHAVLFG